MQLVELHKHHIAICLHLVGVGNKNVVNAHSQYTNSENKYGAKQRQLCCGS